MAIEELGTAVTDKVEAQLVDCTPQPESETATPVGMNDGVSPTEQAQAATVEQTGAGPPPKG